MSVSGEASTGLFFEVTPHLGHLEHYFSYVEKLKPELAKHSGLIWLNRYKALSDDLSLLSYQLWDNEQSIENWRNNKRHRLAQEAGIKTHFKDYRIRIGYRVACWSTGTAIKSNNELAEKLGSLLLGIQSEAPIPHHFFTKYGSFESTYCGLSASNQFVTLVRPNDMFCAKTLASSIVPDLACKIDLFLIGRDYGMVQRNQTSQET